MDEDQIDIESLKAGDVLWFVGSGKTDLISADERDIEDAFIYSGVVEEVTLESFRKGNPPEKEFKITFVGCDDWGMTWRTGSGWNIDTYLTREAALASVREWYDESLKMAEEDLERAKLAVAHMKTRLTADVIETTYPIAHNSGFYFSSLLKKIAESEGASQE